MSMIDEFDCWRGVSWRHGSGFKSNGVILGKDANSITVGAVFMREAGCRCYNDVGGVLTGEVNTRVHLKHCPPPFTKICERPGSFGCYVSLDPKYIFTFSEDHLLSSQVKLIDHGMPLVWGDIKDIRDCQRAGVPEKQILKSDSPIVEKPRVQSVVKRPEPRKVDLRGDRFPGGLQDLWERMQAEADAEDDDFDFEI